MNDSAKRPVIRWIIIAVIAAVLVQMSVGPRGFWALYSQYRNKAELENNIQVEIEKIDSLTRVEQRLQTDSLYIERAARELLGVSRPGETVIKFVDRK